jgi:hypothetical protein
MSGTNRRQEVEKNLAYFLGELPRLSAIHRGKFALLRQQAIVGYYDTVMDALSAGNSLYPDKLFSIQQVNDVASDLGYYSHAMPLGAAQ